MKDHPMLFSGPMIRAILEGRKSQTRRVVTTTRSWIKFYGGDKTAAAKAFHKDASIWNCGGDGGSHWQESDEWTLQNYQEGDRLWVRETWAAPWGKDHEIFYRADGPDRPDDGSWKPSIHMYRWASRITLAITEVRVQRLQSISEEDCVAEGIKGSDCWNPISARNGHKVLKDPKWAYEQLWDSINGKTHPWSENCYVWAITFRKL